MVVVFHMVYLRTVLNHAIRKLERPFIDITKGHDDSLDSAKIRKKNDCKYRIVLVFSSTQIAKKENTSGNVGAQIGVQHSS